LRNSVLVVRIIAAPDRRSVKGTGRASTQERQDGEFRAEQADGVVPDHMGRSGVLVSRSGAPALRSPRTRLQKQAEMIIANERPAHGWLRPAGDTAQRASLADGIERIGRSCLFFRPRVQ
jgi:hypothetical protein